MDYTVHGITKSWTRLSNFHSLSTYLVLEEMKDTQKILQYILQILEQKKMCMQVKYYVKRVIGFERKEKSEAEFKNWVWIEYK